ncbi:MAG: PhoD-like phosphatase N-terminal domain-containing protein, partial [Cytophagales bacterium]|nr:PhoD-like phosphatase N-terminal domain-containing protein [Cytophagales bacterium]
MKRFLKEKYLVDKQCIFSNTWSIFIVAFTFLTLSCETPKKENEIHLGSGAKVGEITSSSAIVHVRTTSLPGQDPAGLIPGTPGEVRIRYANNPGLNYAKVGDWRNVNNNVDHSIQIKLQGLTPGTRYYYQIDYRVDASSEQKTSATWSFPTAPGAQ